METLYGKIKDALKDRLDWENRQRVFYEMRHGGIRRAHKPYANAPDLHFPLVDATIDKHKPFYVQQIYATETMAQFVPRKRDKMEVAVSVGNWFDYQLKQESNFEREAITGIDTLLLGGGCPVKIYWSPERKRLEFDACDPQKIIIPKQTEELQHADFIVHVLSYSVAQYKAKKGFNQDDAFIKRITGKGTGMEENGREQSSELREGLTCGTKDEIVVWECYERDEDDWNKIIVKTRSPLCFEEEIRPDFQLAYKEGIFKEGWLPFVKWRSEIKDKGYYSPRGLAELLGGHEASLNKSWNFKHEFMDFFARPMFTRPVGAQVGNLNNFKTGPGTFLPEGISPATPPPIPGFISEDMNMTRQLAEYRVQAPDFGVLNDEGGKRTATEVNAIAGQTGQGTDLRARIFRLDLADTYKMAWAILLQYAKDSLDYCLEGELQILNADALEDAYTVLPNGSADSWNRNAQFQKALARFQNLRGDPYINQGELRKDLLASDESGLIKRLYVEPQDQQLGEAEEQAMEILVMLKGFPAAIDPTDDDKAHLMTLAQYVEQQLKNQELVEPMFARLALRHGAEHTDALMQKKDPEAQTLNRQLAPIIQILSQIAAQPDPREVAAQEQAQQPPPQQRNGNGAQLPAGRL